MASKSTDRLCEQFERVMRQAWTDVLELKMREDPPDYDWVIRLYREIRDRLCAVLRKGHRVREDMEAKLDVELFGQMIRNNAFQGPEFVGTVYYVFEKCLMLGAPARDEAVTAKRDEVLKAIYEGKVYGELIPLFFLNVNQCIDWMYEDLKMLGKR